MHEDFVKGAFSLDPLVSTQDGLPELSIPFINPRLEFTRDSANTDLIYEVESSNDLHEWTTIARSVGGKRFEAVGIVSDYVAEQPLEGTKVSVAVALYKKPSMHLRVRVRRE